MPHHLVYYYFKVIWMLRNNDSVQECENNLVLNILSAKHIKTIYNFYTAASDHFASFPLDFVFTYVPLRLKPDNAERTGNPTSITIRSI